MRTRCLWRLHRPGDGEAVRSCLMLAVQADASKIATVENLAAPDGSLSALQNAFRKHHALQCGFCTPGVLMTAHALLTHEPFADAARIRDVLSGNLCRCTGYISIMEAVLDAQRTYQQERAGPVTATNTYIGSDIERVEDLRLLTGRGQYVGDLTRKDVLHVATFAARLRTASCAPSTARSYELLPACAP